MPPSKSKLNGVFRISRAAADIILVTQIAGLVAKLLWHSGINTNDWVGFVAISGDTAVFLAYFNFVLFGFIYFWAQPSAFWETLHPTNFGLGLVSISASIGLPHLMGNAYLLVIIGLMSTLAAFFSLRLLLAYPRTTMVVSATLILTTRLWLPGEFAHYTITATGIFLVSIILAVTFRSRPPS